jgi:hypothetical protein
MVRLAHTASHTGEIHRRVQTIGHVRKGRAGAVALDEAHPAGRRCL